mgnify:CR=1 FL=1
MSNYIVETYSRGENLTNLLANKVILNYLSHIINNYLIEK